MLDDGNVNSQGIDAAGAVIDETTWEAYDADGAYISGGHADEATALAVVNAVNAVRVGGNLYGSSKDVGVISGKLPALSENGGRVNRVGFHRKELEGSIEKFGFFDEYTQESLDFDTDGELLMHINREMLRGANEMTEDALQIDLINGAGTVRYAGAATAKSEVGTADLVTYADLMQLAIDLDLNRTPKQTSLISGSRMVDTRTIMGARPLFVGSEMLPHLRAMKDLHNQPAFIPVHQYADAANVMTGEVGSIDAFRIIVVPEMMKFTGAGDTGDGSTYETDGQVDVMPMLVVGQGSFSTIGFQTDGKTTKFKITHKKPGKETADRNDPYGETGFMSVKWYYGSIILRPERLALVLSAATM